MVTTSLELAVDALATYRLTRLVSADTITLPLRAAVIRSAYAWRDGTIDEGWGDALDVDWEGRVRDDDEPPKLAEFVTCRWCVGMWVAAGVAVVRVAAPRSWRVAARVLACSAAAALVAGLED